MPQGKVVKHISKDALTVEEAKRVGLIPEPWHQFISDNCSCGYQMIITKNRKSVYCGNNLCPHKIADRMYNMLQKLGLKGIGPEYCKAYVDKNNCKSHLHILVGQESAYLEGINKQMIIYNIQNAIQQQMTFGEAVSKLSLPGLGSTAVKVFKGYDSWTKVMDKIRSISERGYKDADYMFVSEQIGVGLTAIEVTNVMRAFKEELSVVEELFNIIPEAKTRYNVAITGSLSLGVSREQFPVWIREKTQNQVSVQISKAFASVDYVIADSPSSSRTYREGQARGKLITSEKFMELIAQYIVEESEVKTYEYKKA